MENNMTSAAAGPLAGIRVVEVAMWAFVPAAGGMLADMGASVIKVEPPTGDPLRGLKIGGMSGGGHGFDLSWENYNRGKRGITLDLRQPAGVEILYRLLENADVFLTNLLPPARRRMAIDVDDLRARFPALIYAVGSGLGRKGPEGDKGGYDSISFWARGGVASSITRDDAEWPVNQPGPAFGDLASGAMLAGGVAAAIAKRERTGEAAVVDVSLLAASMWMMQRGVTQATVDGVQRLPRPGRDAVTNPLVNHYRTSDGRHLALCMLQAQRYWAGLCEVAGRPDLAADPRFATAEERGRNARACVAELEALFASRPLAEWRELLSRQDGQWDVVQHVGEMKDDCQVRANGYMQPVAHPGGRALDMVSVPVQFDGAPLPTARAPDLGEHSEAILADLGLDEQAVLDLKIAGVVF
jgi:crotonobetainyl-CoA:carnitine CoA-transferase CaiB-like acyl-CoA transferase